MQIVHTINELRALIKQQRRKGKTIGLVPTMGALHEGHLSLIRRCVAENDLTVISIFVNPLQFGPNEDLDQYPRTLEEDSRKAQAVGTDLIFAPSPQEILGTEIFTYVDIEKLQDNLCGAKRPGHFRGVCTIVTKLFNIVAPDKAYFGQKDIQQLTIIQQMVNDLNFDLEIVPCPIVREHDGLAMSSRNTYLSPTERQEALVLNQGLKVAMQAIKKGETSAQNIIAMIEEMIRRKPSARIDYVKIVNVEMEDVKTVHHGDILALAVFIGTTRLIDNHIIEEKEGL